MTAGWRVECAWTLATLGPDESSRVDLVTRDLDVYRVNAVVGTRRKSLEFAEIRVRLQDAEVKLVKLRQSVSKSFRTSRSQVRREMVGA